MWSITGACTGKVRSTPTALKLILRTVKVSRTAAPTGDDVALEDLDAVAVALGDLHVHADGVAGARSPGRRRAAS